MSRRLLSVISLLMVLFSIFSLPAAAFDDPPEDPIEPDEPYVDIAAFSVGCSVNSSGRATCSSLVETAHLNYTVHLYIALQRYKNGYWQQYAGPWYSSGVSVTALVKYYYVVPGYYYRTIATATVHDENGSFIEASTIYSPIDYY